MSFRTETNTFGIELPRFTYAGGYNPFVPATDVSTLEPNSTSMGGNQSEYEKQFKRLKGEGFDDNTIFRILEGSKGDDDEFLSKVFEKYSDEEFIRKQLDLKNEFEAERLAQAAPYNLMYQIPRTLTQAAVLPATVALGSAKTATDALASMGGINLGGSAINPKAGGYF